MIFAYGRKTRWGWDLLASLWRSNQGSGKLRASLDSRENIQKSVRSDACVGVKIKDLSDLKYMTARFLLKHYFKFL